MINPIRFIRVFFCVLRYVLRTRAVVRYDNSQIRKWYEDNYSEN